MPPGGKAETREISCAMRMCGTSRGFPYAIVVCICVCEAGSDLGSMTFYAHATSAVGEVFPDMDRLVNGGGIRAWERAAPWRVCGTAQSRCRWRIVLGHCGRVDAILAVHLLLNLIRC
jgi:hypothetical protein